MNRQEYTDQMKGLCRKQAELKANHLDALEDLEAQSAKRIAEITEEKGAEESAEGRLPEGADGAGVHEAAAAHGLDPGARRAGRGCVANGSQG